MAKKKQLSITQTKTPFGTNTQFKTNGFTDFEVLGMLTYYKESFLIKMYHENKTQENKTEDEILNELESSITMEQKTLSKSIKETPTKIIASGTYGTTGKTQIPPPPPNRLLKEGKEPPKPKVK